MMIYLSEKKDYPLISIYLVVKSRRKIKLDYKDFMDVLSLN